LAVSAAAAAARAAIDAQEQRLLDDLTTARSSTNRQLDNHIAASHLHVCYQPSISSPIAMTSLGHRRDERRGVDPDKKVGGATR